MKMTEKQRIYMRYFAQGLTNSEIADRMGVQAQTIKTNYEDRMLFKTYSHEREELVCLAKQCYGGQING